MQYEVNINAYEMNQITLYAVQGETDSRTVIFNIIEKSGVQVPTSNAKVINKMLDLTGFSALLYIVKPDGHKVFTEGIVEDGENGKISFVLPYQATTSSGFATCFIVLINGSINLRVAGISLYIEKANIDDAIESTDDFSALQESLNKINNIEDLQKQINNLIIESGTSDAEVIQARLTYETLNERLNAISSWTNGFNNVYNILKSMNALSDNLFDKSQVVTSESGARYISIKYPYASGILIKSTMTGERSVIANGNGSTYKIPVATPYISWGNNESTSYRVMIGNSDDLDTLEIYMVKSFDYWLNGINNAKNTLSMLKVHGKLTDVFNADSVSNNTITVNTAGYDYLLVEGGNVQRTVTLSDGSTVTMYPYFPLIELNGNATAEIRINSNFDNLDNFHIYRISELNPYSIINSLSAEYDIEELGFDDSESTGTGSIRISKEYEATVGDMVIVISGIDYNNTMNICLCDADGNYFETLNTYEPLRCVNIPYRANGFKLYYTAENTSLKLYRLRKKSCHSGHKIYFAGDSIMYGYISKDITADFNIPKIVGMRLGIETANTAVSGKNVTPTSSTYENSILQQVAGIGKVDALSNFLVFDGGTNDYNNSVELGDESSSDIDIDNIDSSTVTFYKAYELMIKTALENFTGQVAAITPLQKVTQDTNDKGYTLEDYVNAVLEICGKYSVPVLDLYHEGMFNANIDSIKSTLYQDTVHPNYKGYNLIGNRVANFLENIMVI